MKLQVNTGIEIGFFIDIDPNRYTAIGFYKSDKFITLKTYFNDTDKECGFEILDENITFYI